MIPVFKPILKKKISTLHVIQLKKEKYQEHIQKVLIYLKEILQNLIKQNMLLVYLVALRHYISQ